MSLKFASIPQKRLLQGIASTSTEFYLTNILSFDGENNVSPSDLGSVHYCAFRNDTGTQVEFMQIDPTTISSGPITILKRGLSYFGDLTTESADRKFDWSANETIVMLGTDVPQIFEWLKEYIDGIAIAGAPDATTSIKGLVKMNKTPDDVSNPYVVGANDIISYAVDSVGTDSYAVTPSPAITAYGIGQIFRFKAGTANTGACTLNVNGLGAKTIKKNVSEDLTTGDILANQIVLCEYDGTNMQLVSKSSLPYIKIDTFTSTSTWTKNGSEKLVKVICIGGGGGGGGGGGSYSTINRGSGGGGSGGSGGSVMIKELLPTALSASAITVTVSPGGLAGGAGLAGGSGGNSSFGSYVIAYGGNGGNPGGGGGMNTDGNIGAIVNGVSSVTGVALSATPLGLQGATGNKATEYGGAGGTASSIFGGSGGGTGYRPLGIISGPDASVAAGLGGTYAVADGVNNGSAGASRETLGTPYCGGGGSGGNGLGVVGGAGSIGSGGGGGAGGANTLANNPGYAGGAGGRGEVIVISYY